MSTGTLTATCMTAVGQFQSRIQPLEVTWEVSFKVQAYYFDTTVKDLFVVGFFFLNTQTTNMLYKNV